MTGAVQDGRRQSPPENHQLDHQPDHQLGEDHGSEDQQSQLRDLLDHGVDVGWFTPCDRAELRSHLRHLQIHRGRLDAVEANVIAALNRLGNESATRAKPSDAADDIKEQTGASGAEANRKAKRASLLDRWPAITDALAEGRITSGHADLLCGVPERFHPDLERDLKGLLRRAQCESVDEFKLTVRDWRDRTASENGEDPHQLRRDRRSCSIHNQSDGMVRLNALLDPEAGGIVRNAITRRAQQLLRDDQTQDDAPGRSYQQRLADALTQISAANSGNGTSSAEPAVVVTIPLADLQNGLDGDVLGAGPVSAETARKLACEGALIPAVLGSDGAVLDLGRRSRLATSAQRLALAIRYDNHCAAPGCDRPFEWCHIHHIDHWEHGGPTDLENLIPVCTRHHTQIHEGRLEVARINGADEWRKGSHTDRPPQQQLVKALHAARARASVSRDPCRSRPAPSTPCSAASTDAVLRE